MFSYRTRVFFFPDKNKKKTPASSHTARRRDESMLFALVPLSGLADKNTTAYPVTGSGGTYICPMKNNCCYNPGEDSDGSAVVRAGRVARRR